MRIVFLDCATLKSSSSLDDNLSQDMGLSASDILARLKEYGDYVSFETTNKDLVYERAKEADIIITNKVKLDREMLEKLSRLKCIVVAASGMDNIDLKTANELGIKVKNSLGYAEHSVPYNTMAMYFHLNQSLMTEKKYVQQFKWQEHDCFSFYQKFSDLSDQVWGIIGLGKIGLKLAGIVESFGAKVIYYSSHNEVRSDRYEKCDLQELLIRSHIISIHSSLTEKTKHLIGINELNMMQNCHTLLNLGRGAILNEKELIPFLKNSKLKIGLDVLEEEPLLKHSAVASILNRPNTIITPHMAWASVQSRTALTQSIVKNVEDFLSILS